MVFSCAPNFHAKAAAKKQALKQKLAGAGAYHGVSLRLLLVDRQVDAQDVLPNAALGCVHVVKYDAHSTTLAQLVGLIREAHRQNGAPFLSMAIAQHGADAEGQWEWTTDLTVNLKSMHGAIDQLAPVVEVLAAALSKTKAGKAHIDLLACNLATTCKGLVPALEKMYGIDFRASTDETGNDLSGGDWKMETDNDYDVAADYLDADKLKEYTETMCICKKASCEPCTLAYAIKRELVAPTSAHQPTEAELREALNKADGNPTNHGYDSILQRWNLSNEQRITVWRRIENCRKKDLAKPQYQHPKTDEDKDKADAHKYEMQQCETICKFYMAQQASRQAEFLRGPKPAAAPPGAGLPKTCPWAKKE